jgi:hypothetical protein
MEAVEVYWVFRLSLHSAKRSNRPSYEMILDFSRYWKTRDSVTCPGPFTLHAPVFTSGGTHRLSGFQIETTALCNVARCSLVHTDRRFRGRCLLSPLLSRWKIKKGNKARYVKRHEGGGEHLRRQRASEGQRVPLRWRHVCCMPFLGRDDYLLPVQVFVSCPRDVTAFGVSWIRERLVFETRRNEICELSSRSISNHYT